MNRRNAFGKIFVASGLFIAAHGISSSVLAASVDYTACVRNLNFTSGTATVPMWGFATSAGTSGCMMMGAAGRVPGNQIELAAGDTLNLTLNMMMSPQENAPPPSPNYNGHTIHLHGADVPTLMDGVPETSQAIISGSYKYVWDTTSSSTTSAPIGSFIYHCHVHTVKHLDMGMYGPIIIRPRNATGTTLMNQITADSASSFDREQTYVISAVDPAYHTAVGDSPVFADYNPVYFLLNGTEGISTATPASAATLSGVLAGQRIALHLVDPLSIYGTFSIKNAAGVAQKFIVYVEDGRAITPVPAGTDAVTSLEIGPGKRFDIVFTMPTTTTGTAATVYPQIEFKNPRGQVITVRNPDGSTRNAAVYGKVAF